MSLINQVLKDIDQRGGTRTASSPLDDNVRSVGERGPANTSRGRMPMLLGGLVLIAGAAGGFWWLRGGTADTVVPIVAPILAVTDAPAIPTPSDPAAASTSPLLEEDPAAAAMAFAEFAAGWERTLADAEASGITSPQAPAPPLKTAPLATAEVKKTVTSEQASDALYMRAERAFRERRPVEGQQLLRDALDRNPGNHLAREWLASVLLELGRAAEAETWLTEGVALAPDRRGFVLPLALLRQQVGNEAGALQLLESSIASLANDAEAHAFLATLLQRQGRHTEATEHYVTALRQYPSNARWLVGLGLSLQAQGMRQAAIEAFESALATRSLEPGLETLATNQLLSARQGG